MLHLLRKVRHNYRRLHTRALVKVLASICSNMQSLRGLPSQCRKPVDLRSRPTALNVSRTAFFSERKALHRLVTTSDSVQQAVREVETQQEQHASMQIIKPTQQEGREGSNGHSVQVMRSGSAEQHPASSHAKATPQAKTVRNLVFVTSEVRSCVPVCV